jgi:hypothetical protein
MAVDGNFYLDAPTTDLRLSGSLAALSAKGVMDGMPSSQRPQPLGNGMWELVQGELRVLLRERPKALEFALTAADLERAAGVASAASGGRRLKVHAAELPPGMLSADAFPLPSGLRRQVSGVLREASSAALELDAGTDRDLVLELAADAPFERLGLSPLGAARVQPSALEGGCRRVRPWWWRSRGVRRRCCTSSSTAPRRPSTSSARAPSRPRARR